MRSSIPAPREPRPTHGSLQTHTVITPIGSLNALFGFHAEPTGQWWQQGQLRALTGLTRAVL